VLTRNGGMILSSIGAENTLLYFKFDTYVAGQQAEIEFDKHVKVTSPYYRKFIFFDAIHSVRNQELHHSSCITLDSYSYISVLKRIIALLCA
jgi:hypothetical protein